MRFLASMYFVFNLQSIIEYLFRENNNSNFDGFLVVTLIGLLKTNHQKLCLTNKTNFYIYSKLRFEFDLKLFVCEIRNIRKC